MGKAKRPARFTHGRPGCQNDQIRLLQSSRQAIQVREASRDADDGTTPVVKLFELFHVCVQDIAYGDEVGVSVVLADVEDELFSFFQGNVGVGLLISNGGDLPCGVDEAAQNRSTLDDAGVVFNVAARGNQVDERSDVAGTTNRL